MLIILAIIIIVLLVIISFYYITSSNTSSEFYDKQNLVNQDTVDLYNQLQDKIINCDLNLSKKIDCPIYYINMDTSVDRNIWMIEQFKRFNLTNYTRIPGVDINNTNIKFKTDYPDTGDSAYESKRYGCLLAHIQCVMKFLKSSDASFCLICEDDANFNIFPRLNFSLSDLVEKSPFDWEIINLFNLFCHATNGNANIQYSKRKKNTSEQCWSTVAYLLSKKGALRFINTLCESGSDGNCDLIHIKYIVSNQYPQNPVADDYIYGICTTYYCSPCLIYPYNPDELPDKHPLTSCIQDVMKMSIEYTPILNDTIQIN